MQDMNWIGEVKRALDDSNNEKIVAVFREFQLESEAAAIDFQSGDSEHKARIKATLRRLIESGCHRRLVQPGGDWAEKLQALGEQFPNFHRAISEVILPSLAIAAAGGIARPAPLLLVGPPGVGKSYFAEMLSRLLAVPKVVVDMASASTGATLGGLAVHWSNAGPGEVFKALALGRAGQKAVANPLIILDELDKVSTDHRYDPLGPLYSLLEHQTACRYEDASLPGVEMDASHIRWMLCANRVEPIPRPILSRVHVVHVPEPSAGERKRMFAGIFSDVVRSLVLDEFDATVDVSVLAMADIMGPREFKTRSVMAVGRALADKRWQANTDDFSVGVLPVPSKRIGFV